MDTWDWFYLGCKVLDDWYSEDNIWFSEEFIDSLVKDLSQKFKENRDQFEPDLSLCCTEFNDYDRLLERLNNEW